MRIDIGIQCDNAAFEKNPAEEVARILRELANRLNEGIGYCYQLRDLNGNNVGSATWDSEEENPFDMDED